MDIPSFKKWVQHRDAEPVKNMPESDRLLHILFAAGRRGLSRQEIGNEIDLDRHLLDQLLLALAQAGQVSVANQNGIEVYRAEAS